MDVFSHNGVIKSSAEAQTSLYSVEFTYGFGVYENVRVKNGSALYADEHVARLLSSAAVIALDHPFQATQIEDYIQTLSHDISELAYNLKILLIGASPGGDPQLYILPLKPKFPDRKLYKRGAAAITINCERYLPNAKTLNMLPSYLAYRTATEAGAYDAILVNRHGQMLEGTRTNIFALRGRDVLTPPADEVLIGVTRTHVLATAEKNEFNVIEQPLPLEDIATFDSLFLTSTSSKIMPLNKVDEIELSIAENLRELMVAFNADW